MIREEHIDGLGRVEGNLQSLELCLRAFVVEANGETWELPQAGATSVPENHMTNWDTLETLIRKYDSKLTSPQSQLYSVDPRIVQVRDALAHGRLCAMAPEFPLTLWRFGKPRRGMVPIEQVVKLSTQWLDVQRTLILDQMARVYQCAEARGYKSVVIP